MYNLIQFNLYHIYTQECPNSIDSFSSSLTQIIYVSVRFSIDIFPVVLLGFFLCKSTYINTLISSYHITDFQLRMCKKLYKCSHET